MGWIIKYRPNERYRWSYESIDEDHKMKSRVWELENEGCMVIIESQGISDAEV